MPRKKSGKHARGVSGREAAAGFASGDSVLPRDFEVHSPGGKLHQMRARSIPRGIRAKKQIPSLGGCHVDGNHAGKRSGPLGFPKEEIVAGADNVHTESVGVINPGFESLDRFDFCKRAKTAVKDVVASIDGEHCRRFDQSETA